MQPFDRNIPYNSLPGLPPAESLYKDDTLIVEFLDLGCSLSYAPANINKVISIQVLY